MEEGEPSSSMTGEGRFLEGKKRGAAAAEEREEFDPRELEKAAPLGTEALRATDT